jgi:hypothetical protein
MVCTQKLSMLQKQLKVAQDEIAYLREVVEKQKWDGTRIKKSKSVNLPSIHR